MPTLHFTQYETIRLDCTLDTPHTGAIVASVADMRGQVVGDFAVIRPANLDELPKGKTHFALVLDKVLAVGQYRANVFFMVGDGGENGHWVATDSFIIDICHSPTVPPTVRQAQGG